MEKMNLVRIITRQRKWQLLQIYEGNCIICGKPAVNKKYCKAHRKKTNEKRNKKPN